LYFFFSSRRRHTRSKRDWSSDVCSSDLEIIPHKASMGYLHGYTDPEYIESLQNISLPFLKTGKYRAFPVEGDSMPPHKEGSFIVGGYVDQLKELKVGRTYVGTTSNEGTTYKRL